MSSNRNTELRVVSSVAEADNSRSTLRIDAERPVPAPTAIADSTQAQKLATAERELDRLQQAVHAEQLALSQHMNWLIASQAILIHAFLMLFVIGATGVVYLNYWLLGGVALIGVLCALALHGGVDRASKSAALLVVQRRAVELELAALGGRTPNLPKEASRAVGWAGPMFVATWLSLLAYSVAIRM